MIPMSEPFHTYFAIDVLRCAIAACAWWLFALTLRLTIKRYRGRATDAARYDRVHPASMLSYSLCLLFMGVRRVDNLGDPWSWYMVPSILILALGYLGVLRRISVRILPHWRRAR